MSQKNVTKEYTNGEITVVWKPGVCSHSTKCFKGLPGVFDPNARPWINMEGASTEAIMEQVQQCPSGALSFYRNAEGKPVGPEAEAGQQVEVTLDGPLLVHGNLRVKLPDGSEESRERTTAFCRCGASGKKPYCDGSHRRTGFKG